MPQPSYNFSLLASRRLYDLHRHYQAGGSLTHSEPSHLEPCDWPTKRKRKPRKPSIDRLIKQAEKAGKPVISVTLPDGTKLHFGEFEAGEATNPWLAKLEKAAMQ